MSPGLGVERLPGSRVVSANWTSAASSMARPTCERSDFICNAGTGAVSLSVNVSVAL